MLSAIFVGATGICQLVPEISWQFVPRLVCILNYRYVIDFAFFYMLFDTDNFESTCKGYQQEEKQKKLKS